MFVGRDRELKKLNEMYESDWFEFAVLYGRRRVGKTTLIREFMRDSRESTICRWKEPGRRI